ncbi:MAG: hypothetical protein J6N72_02820 [Psychrobacter sp.]|nr:hypothetical protein [Psychrobacter sp.]
MTAINMIVLMAGVVITPYLLLILMNTILGLADRKNPGAKIGPKSIFDYIDAHFTKLVGICLLLTAIPLALTDHLMSINESHGFLAYQLFLGFGCLTTILLLNKPSNITRQQRQRRQKSK